MNVRDLFLPHHRRWKAEEDEKNRRLAEAEVEARDLTRRADDAISFLSARQKRNHWREAIQQIIQEGRTT